MKCVAGGIVLAIGLLLMSPAQAHDQGYTQADPALMSFEWRDYHAVGSSCGGEVSSRYVKSVKAILWADGDIEDMTWIDQDFTSGTATNVKQYQAKHGLSQDGCVGYNTWSSMQHDKHYNTQLGVYQKHMTPDGSDAAGDYYQWREQGKARHVRYYKYTDPCGHSCGLPDFCWVLLMAKNDAYNTFATYGVYIEHNMNERCDG